MKKILTDKSLNISIVDSDGLLVTQLEMLKQKKADYALSYFNPTNLAMEFSKRIDERQFAVSEVLNVPLYFAIKSSRENAESILAAVNQAMQ